LNQTSAIRVPLVSLLLLVLVSTFVVNANAQITNSHWDKVAVKPATPTLIMHASVAQNFSVPFQAMWASGNFLMEAVQNANITVEIKNAEGDSVENITQTTNATGYAAFNYSSPVPDILTFTPIRAVTQDEKEWNTSLTNFQLESVTVYCDTFDAALVSTNTETLGLTEVSVNVTYLLVPEEGLTLPPTSNSSQQDIVSKIVHGANVTINGVKAEETAVHGVYTASFATWSPTAYVLVEVSHENWVPVHEGFSFAHNANGAIWTPAIILCVACAAVALALYIVLSRKSNRAVGFRETVCPVFGGVTLAVASFISLYWGIVAFDGALHGFDWALLGVTGIGSFGFGLVGSVMAMKKKNQTLAISAVCAPLIANAVAVKATLDIYQLTAPWLIIVLALAIAIISGILISNAAFIDNKK